MRNPTFLWKDENSGKGGCSSLTAVEGGYAVVGSVLDGAERQALAALVADNDSPIADGEDILFVPANVLDKLRGK